MPFLNHFPQSVSYVNLNALWRMLVAPPLVMFDMYSGIHRSMKDKSHLLVLIFVINTKIQTTNDS